MGSSASRASGQEYGQGRQTAASVSARIVHPDAFVRAAHNFGHPGMLRQHRIDEGVVSVQQTEKGTVVVNHILNEPDRRREHCLAQRIIEAWEALAIDWVVFFEPAEIEPVAGKVDGQPARGNNSPA